ncbi:MAG: hypothetical protein AB7P00_21655 [Sandaracinaceae bacterium]
MLDLIVELPHVELARLRRLVDREVGVAERIEVQRRAQPLDAARDLALEQVRLLERVGPALARRLGQPRLDGVDAGRELFGDLRRVEPRVAAALVVAQLRSEALDLELLEALLELSDELALSAPKPTVLRELALQHRGRARARLGAEILARRLDALVGVAEIAFHLGEPSSHVADPQREGARIALALAPRQPREQREERCEPRADHETLERARDEEGQHHRERRDPSRRR